MFVSRPLFGVHGQQVSAVQDISTTNLVAYWKMNAGTGTAAVSETGDHQGTLVGSPTWVTGKSGTGVSLNGTSQYINVTKTTALNITGNAVSIMAWINPTTVAGARRILGLPLSESGGGEKYFILLNASTVQFWIGVTSTSGQDHSVSASFTSTGTWSHICGVYNGTDMRLYVNGSLVGSPTNKTGNMNSSTNGDVQIGRFGPTFGQYFSGIVDEARIYSRAITSTEVSTVHSLG